MAKLAKVGGGFKFKVQAHSATNHCGTSASAHCFIAVTYPTIKQPCTNGQSGGGLFAEPNGFISGAGKFSYSQKLSGPQQPLLSFTAKLSGSKVTGTLREKDLYDPGPAFTSPATAARSTGRRSGAELSRLLEWTTLPAGGPSWLRALRWECRWLRLGLNRLGHPLAGAVQPGGDRRLAHVQGPRRLAVGQADHVDGDQRVAEVVGQRRRSWRTARRPRVWPPAGSHSILDQIEIVGQRRGLRAPRGGPALAEIGVPQHPQQVADVIVGVQHPRLAQHPREGLLDEILGLLA